MFEKGFWQHSGCSTCNGWQPQCCSHQKHVRWQIQTSGKRKNSGDVRLLGVPSTLFQLQASWRILDFCRSCRCMPKRANGWAIRAALSGTPPHAACWMPTCLHIHCATSCLRQLLNSIPLWHPATAISSKLGVLLSSCSFFGASCRPTLGWRVSWKCKRRRRHPSILIQYQMSSVFVWMYQVVIFLSDDKRLEVLIALVWDLE